MPEQKKLRYDGYARLSAAGIDNARAECDWLLCNALSCNQTQMLLTREIPQDAALRFEKLLDRRIAGEPVQYLLGEWDFCGLPFYVGTGVLIPRPETELLAWMAIECAKKISQPVIADLCAGTGCIGLTAAKQLPNAKVYLLEKSPEAICYLERNHKRLKAENAVLINDDVLNPSKPLPPISCLLSNPPYIPSGEIASLQRELHFEPSMAQDGGADGLLFYRAIAKKWTKRISSEGIILLELGDGQYDSVSRIFRAEGFNTSATLDDSGHLRILKAVLKK